MLAEYYEEGEGAAYEEEEGDYQGDEGQTLPLQLLKNFKRVHESLLCEEMPDLLLKSCYGRVSCMVSFRMTTLLRLLLFTGEQEEAATEEGAEAATATSA